MSSPPVASHNLSTQRSAASSSTLTSPPLNQPLEQDRDDRSPLAVSKGNGARPRHGTNGQIDASLKSNGSPVSKKGSIGRSGGFLLASTFRHGSLGRSERRNGGLSHGISSWDKHRPVEGTPQRANGVKMAQIPINASRQVPVDTGMPSISGNAPFRDHNSSPFSETQDTQNEQFTPDQVLRSWNGAPDPPVPQQNTAIDPSQIVSMALNLSEGRRRHMSGHGLPSTASGSSPRVLSATAPVLQRPYSQGAGGSLRKHLQDQRRISRNVTAEVGRNSPGARIPSGFGGPEMDSSVPYRLSDATLARAEKARQHFALSFQYHRLLSHLPPLHVNKDINDVNYHDGHVNSENQLQQGDDDSDLGRAYNPLQLIRNRKARARARKSLEPAPEIWQHPLAVNDWINVVENIAHRPSYIHGDSVVLPRYPPKQYEHLVKVSNASEDSHVTGVGKPTLPRLDWFVSPSELLADAYWLEQNHNKLVIEDRHGTPIYPAMIAPQDLRASLDSRRSHQGSAHVSAGSEKAHDSEAESHLDGRGRRRDMPLDNANNDGSGRFKQAWHKARRRSRSASSDVSPSDNERARKLRRNKSRQVSDYLNTGPLERHLNSMIYQQGLAPAPLPPELISPGTPKKWGLDVRKPTDKSNSSEDNGKALQSDAAPRQSRLKTPDDLPQGPSQIVSTLRHDERLSLDHSSPGSPVINTFLSRSATENFVSNGRRTSPPRKPIKHFFPFSKGEPKDSKRFESGGHEDSDRSSRSRRQSEEPKSLRPSLDVHGSPIQGQGLLLDTRVNESLHSLAASPPLKTRDGKVKEPDSAVRRFFKGGMIGLRRDGTKIKKSQDKKDVVYEDHTTTDDADSESMDESDTEDTSGTSGRKSGEPSKRPRRGDHTSAVVKVHEPSVGRKRKGQYHVDLPTFRPSGHSPVESRPTTPDEAKQPRQLSHTQSPLRVGSSPVMYNIESATPLLSTTSLAMVPSQSDLRSPDQLQPRPKRGILSHFHSRPQTRPTTNQQLVAAIDDSTLANSKERDGVSSNALTALRETGSPSLAVPPQRHQNSDRRHWSISNAEVRRASGVHHLSTLSTISHAEIARVRALLICTGVKAAALARRSQGSEDYPTALPSTKNAQIRQFPAGGQAIVAIARQLTATLDQDTASVHDAAIAFRKQTANPLHHSLHNLRIVVGECAERARTAGDEAVGFGALVTGQKTIEVRRVIDQMEKFRRKRRRRLRWIRRVGFGLLEWGVLLVMWQVWLVVVTFKTIWGILKGTVRVTRWALWL